MKRGFYSTLVIISTITTCILLNIILNDKSYENNNGENLIQIRENKSITNKVENDESKKINKKEVNKQNNKENEAKGEIVNSQVVNDDVSLSGTSGKSLSSGEYYNENESYNVGEIANEEINNYKSVFKVDSRTIVSNLSMFDKLKLLSICSKLSKTDYKKIDGYLKEDNAEEGVKKAYNFLKEKLNAKDMEKIKGILESYIDVSVIEKK